MYLNLDGIKLGRILFPDGMCFWKKEPKSVVYSSQENLWIDIIVHPLQ